MTLLATLLTETTHEELAPLLMPPVAFGAVAAVVFLVLGVVVFSYRDVANRHSQKWAKGGHDSHTAGH